MTLHNFYPIVFWWCHIILPVSNFTISAQSIVAALWSGTMYQNKELTYILTSYVEFSILSKIVVPTKFCHIILLNIVIYFTFSTQRQMSNNIWNCKIKPTKYYDKILWQNFMTKYYDKILRQNNTTKYYDKIWNSRWRRRRKSGCRVADKIMMMAFLRMGCCIPIIYRRFLYGPFFLF